MPSRKQSSQKRAQGGGRTANSEPRLQVFRDFNGIDFGNANRLQNNVTVSEERTDPGDQTDLQMNYLFLQNNAAVTRNKTIEVRDELVLMFESPIGVTFTGPACLIGPKLYLATSDKNVYSYDIDDYWTSGEPITDGYLVPLENNTGSSHTWTSFEYYDDKLIAMTKQNEMWVGDVGGVGYIGIDPPNNQEYLVDTLANSKQVPQPILGNLQFTPKGSLTLGPDSSDTTPYRIEITYTYVNKFGPTETAGNAILYANQPVSGWHTGRYLRLSGPVPSGYDIEAIEMYYLTDNATEMIFLGRADVAPGATTWSYNWYGYVDATSMWPMANLLPPTENYTKGVHASRITDIDGRLYFWGDSDNEQRLYIGGNPGNLLSISPGTGGGFVDVEPGTGQAIKYVCKYKTQSGASIVTMLCDSPNTHKEQRFNLVENQVSLSYEQNMKSWQAEQVAGAVGCKSYHGAVVCADGLYSVSRYGLALTTMTMEYNAQIRTNYVSDQIKPVFVDSADKNTRLSWALLLEIDGILYMALGASSDQGGDLDNVIFCYDIDQQAWWTYTLDMDYPIRNMIHIDWGKRREGIGIVTSNGVYLLPTTVSDDESEYISTRSACNFLLQTAQLSTQMPQQGWQYLSQLEFHFDYFIGDATIKVRMVDMFGRELEVAKVLTEDDELFDYTVHMRIDQRIMSYVISMTGRARFRMTHFIAKVYTLSNKIGQVWGFDDRISHRTSGSVHPTFKCYNDIRKAIFT